MSYELIKKTIYDIITIDLDYQYKDGSNNE